MIFTLLTTIDVCPSAWMLAWGRALVWEVTRAPTGIEFLSNHILSRYNPSKSKDQTRITLVRTIVKYNLVY